MSRRPHDNAISIGPDRWIDSGALPEGRYRRIDLDPYLSPLLPLLEVLETECVAACCGIDAFGLWPDQIGQAVCKGRTLPAEWLARLRSVQAAIRQLPPDSVVVSTRLNQLFPRQTFLALLVHIGGTIEAMANKNAQS